MFIRRVIVGMIILRFSVVPAVSAGYYSSIDARETEMPYSADFDVFGKAMDVLGTIPVPKPAKIFPIRQRYILIESMARDETLKLDTLEQKLNYSTVLIRRGRAFEAARFLEPVYQENRENFLVLSQFATAHFLSSNRDFEVRAPIFMQKALKLWPKKWADVKEGQKTLLETFGWDEYDYDRYRRCEVLLERLMVNRLKEKKLQDEKKPVADTVDPIFLDAKEEPIRFLNEKGEYEPGRIAAPDKEQMPRDSIELVEQLLIWMPNDERLLWLLAETFNASAMEHQNKKGKSMAVLNANKIFQRLLRFETPTKYGRKEITERQAVLQVYVDANPVDTIQPPVEDPNDVKMTSLQWWRTLAVVFALGLAIGMFALWQTQEVRRRRQARAAPGS
jgi:hypothetical protein